MRPEYDLAELLKGGVRGKYVERYRAGTNVVLLAPDVAQAFPTEDAVNEALRLVMRMAQRFPWASSVHQRRNEIGWEARHSMANYGQVTSEGKKTDRQGGARRWIGDREGNHWPEGWVLKNFSSALDSRRLVG